MKKRLTMTTIALLAVVAVAAQKPKDTFDHHKFASKVVANIGVNVTTMSPKDIDLQYISTVTKKPLSGLKAQNETNKKALLADVDFLKKNGIALVLDKTELSVSKAKPIKTANIILYCHDNDKTYTLTLTNCIQTNSTWVLGDRIKVESAVITLSTGVVCNTPEELGQQFVNAFVQDDINILYGISYTGGDLRKTVQEKVTNADTKKSMLEELSHFDDARVKKGIEESYTGLRNTKIKITIMTSEKLTVNWDSLVTWSKIKFKSFDFRKNEEMSQKLGFDMGQGFVHFVYRNSSYRIRIDKMSHLITGWKGLEYGNIEKDAEWMTTNLNESKFRNGEPIPEAKTEAEWLKANDDKTPAWCHFNNDPANGGIYGKLYNFYAVSDPRGLAPEGSHIATDEEWTTLTNNSGGESSAGLAMKSATGWETGNGNNSSGFTGLPGGARSDLGKFNLMGISGFWWTTSEEDSFRAWYHVLIRGSNSASKDLNSKAAGFSVRCIKD